MDRNEGDVGTSGVIIGTPVFTEDVKYTKGVVKQI